MRSLVACCNGGLLVVEPGVVNQPELTASEAVVLQVIAGEWVTLQEVPFVSDVYIAGDGTNDKSTSYNVVEGNYLGTDYTGTHALGNSGDGVDIASGAQRL
jgi:hypothetical protein